MKKLDADQRAQIEEVNRELDEGVFAAEADPRKLFVPPPRSPVPPHLNFAPLENGIDALTRSAQKYDAARTKATPSNIQAVNAKLIDSERRLTDSVGLPGRPWFRHMIYAPDFIPDMASKPFLGSRGHRAEALAGGRRADPTGRNDPYEGIRPAR